MLNIIHREQEGKPTMTTGPHIKHTNRCIKMDCIYSKCFIGGVWGDFDYSESLMKLQPRAYAEHRSNDAVGRTGSAGDQK